MPTSILHDGLIALGSAYSQNDIANKAANVFSKMFPDNPLMLTADDEVRVSSKHTVKPIATDTDKLDIGRRMSPTGFVERIVKLPHFNQSAIITAQQLKKRMFGSTPFSAHSESEAFTYLLSASSELHFLALENAVEKMCVDAFMKGKLVFENNVEIDFGLPITHNSVVATFWDSNTANPIDDIDAMMRVIHRDGRSDRFEVWMGRNAMARFEANTLVREYFRTYQAGQLTRTFNVSINEEPNNPIRSLGRVLTPNGYWLEIKCYNAFYDTFDANGNRNGSVDFFPENKVLIRSVDCACQMAKGRPVVMPQPVMSSVFGYSPYNLVEVDGSIIQTILQHEDIGIELRTRACLAPIILSPDRFGIIEVL